MIVSLAFCAALVAACNGVPGIPDESGEADVFDKVRSIDLLPRFPGQVRQEQVAGGRRVKPAIYSGDEAAGEVAPRPVAGATGDSFDLNFENAPVASVTKAVLGDILGLGYIIDSRVQGTVSLSSGRPVPKSDLVFVLENALRLNGIALVRDGTAYRLMPQGDAVGAGGVDSAERSQPGYGVSAVPLRYVSAQTLLKLIDSFVAKPGMVRVEPGRNLVLIQGTGSERRNVVEMALNFDADWMRGQSVGIFPVQNGNPEPIIAELEKILDSGDGGVTQGVVKFQTIARMNAIMAVTRKPEMLRRVETWIKRLDAVDSGRSSVHVYTVKYGEARNIARVLNEMFVGGNASAALDGAAGQIAPGSGLSSSSSGSSALGRLSGGGGGSGSSSTGFGSSRSQSSGSGLGSSSTGGGTGGAAASAQTGQGGNLFDNRGGGLFDGRSAGGTGAAAGAGGPGNSSVLQGVRITADTVNNTLLIYANPENYSLIERTLRQIDRPQLQVAIDATVAEVTLTDNLRYGVQFYLTAHNVGLPPNVKGSVLNTTANAVTSTLINRAFPGFNFLVGSESAPNVILEALHDVTTVKILSSPSVVVIDNQVATLQVGDEVPVSTGSATVLTTSNTVVNSIDYRNTGIILRVVPRINANGNVRLEIEQEISNVTPDSTGSLTPTVSQRKVRSAIAVASGQTVLLAGLISERQSGTRSGVPVLDQIPGVGEAFSHNEKKITRTELIIFIRPQIIRDSVDAHFVAEELRTKLKGSIGPVGASPVLVPSVR